ncbi:MAG TPA: hypothetical protein VH880_07940 [Anaeromyxobacteraceae bacterium]|jgi:hypothetical protein
MTTSRTISAAALLGVLAACSQSTTFPQGGGGTAGVAGIALPTEISALPPKGDAAGAGLAIRAATIASDYESARTVKFVDEQALRQFDILNTIFGALAQTRYADAENVGAGPYGAVVSWEEERGDGQAKRLENWVVDSQMVKVGDRDVNRLLVWVTELDEQGQVRVVRAKVEILEAPATNPDGSYADYGVWTLDAKFDDAGTSYFAASAARGAGGESTVTVHEVGLGGGAGQPETRGVLVRGRGVGIGKVEYADWSACESPDCVPPPAAVAYAYDADNVALRKGAEATRFKSRSRFLDVVNRYGLYDAATGDDVARTRSFGFPIRWTEGGAERWGYYGAWQGRHQIWANGAALAGGSSVVRADRGPGQAPETFVASPTFAGTLVRRTLAPADVQDLAGIPVETWVGESFDIAFDGAGWTSCKNPDHATAPPTCGAGSGPVDLATLANDPSNPRRQVFLNRWDPVAGQSFGYSYLLAGPSGPGFYLTTMLPGEPPVVTSTLWLAAAGDHLWVNVNGSIFIAFDGTGWVQKKVVAFDPQSGQPTFDPGGDVPYLPDLGREYYVNTLGTNYVVKRTGADTYEVQIELQAAANPANAKSLVPDGAEFRPQWGGDGSTYAFVTDPGSSFLKLVYKTVGASSAASPGDAVTSGQWGLLGWSAAGDPLGQFNWDYPPPGQSWGSQQFLVDAAGAYRLLDDPIRLQPLTLANGAGELRTLSLQFDGNWVSGLPDVWNELRKNGFDVTPEIAARAIAIPSGEEVVDAGPGGAHYRFKQLVVSEYLRGVPDPGNLDVGPAEALDLGLARGFVDNGMGARPEVPVKYSEGKPVD